MTNRKPQPGEVWVDNCCGTPFLRVHEDFRVPVWVALSGVEMANSLSDGSMIFAADSVSDYFKDEKSTCLKNNS